MNKEIKRIIAIVLTISAFSVIEPIKYINLTGAEKASAEVTGADLKDISLEKGQVDFKSSKTTYTVNLKSSIEKLEISAKPKDSNATVEINGTEVSEDNNYERVVNLDKGENTIYIKVTNGSKKKTYTLNIIRGEVEEIFLKNITLDNGKINFSKETTSYDIDVDTNTKVIDIKAEPEEDNYEVEINGTNVDDDNDYERTVALDKGKNEIKIRIEDKDGTEKTYTLNINRAATASTTTSSNTQNPVVNTPSKGWVSNNGQWCYFNEDGSKQTGWSQINGKWYYLDSNGIMKTGWQFVNNEWYYLELNGTMKTGWFKNSDGKWYFLYNSGVMAKNTTIDGYKLNTAGAWIS